MSYDVCILFFERVGDVSFTFLHPEHTLVTYETLQGEYLVNMVD